MGFPRLRVFSPFEARCFTARIAALVGFMSNHEDQERRTWVMPSEKDVAAWQTLSREEQLEALREHLAHQSGDGTVTHSIEEVWAAIRDRRRAPAEHG